MPTPSPIHRRAGSPSWRRSPLFRWLRRPAAYWTVVALLAVVTVLGASRQSNRQQQLADTYGDLREVPVAVTLIRPGEALGDDVVRWEQRPATAVPAGTAVDLADEAVASAAIYPGEVVHAERVAGSGSGLSGRLAPDVAAVSVPAAYGVPPVQPGDRVHLIAVFDTALGNGTGSTTPTAVTVARHATVVELDEEAVTVAIRTAEVETTVAALVWGAVAVVAVGGPPG